MSPASVTPTSRVCSSRLRSITLAFAPCTYMPSVSALVRRSADQQSFVDCLPSARRLVQLALDNVLTWNDAPVVDLEPIVRLTELTQLRIQYASLRSTDHVPRAHLKTISHLSGASSALNRLVLGLRVASRDCISSARRPSPSCSSKEAPPGQSN